MTKPLLIKRRNVPPAIKCARCGVPRTHENFNRNKQRKDGLSGYCRDCRKKDYHDNKSKWFPEDKMEERSIYRLNRVYWTKYRLRYNDVLNMLKEQNNQCAICYNTIGFRLKRSGISVDHDHKTGKARGLLCFNCNSGLGQFKDNIKVLEKAIEYLKKYN